MMQVMCLVTFYSGSSTSHVTLCVPNVCVSSMKCIMEDTHGTWKTHMEPGKTCYYHVHLLF